MTISERCAAAGYTFRVVGLTGFVRSDWGDLFHGSAAELDAWLDLPACTGCNGQGCVERYVVRGDVGHDGPVRCGECDGIGRVADGVAS